MVIGNWRRLFYTDFPADQQSLIQKLSIPLNSSMESLYNAMNNNVSLNDNIACTVKTITVTVDGTGKPVANGTSSFVVGVTTAITGISVLKATDNTNNNTYPTSAPFISYSQSSTTVTINNITGLVAGDNWQLVIVAWY